MILCTTQTEARLRGRDNTWRCARGHQHGVVNVLPEQLAAVIEALQHAEAVSSMFSMSGLTNSSAWSLLFLLAAHRTMKVFNLIIYQ